MAVDEKEQIDTREYLKPHLGKRITIEGRIRQYGNYYDTSLRRMVPGVLLTDVDMIYETGNRWAVTGHVWVTFSSPVSESGAGVGDVVRCSTLVYRYEKTDKYDHNKRFIRYGLRDPVEVEVVRQLADAYMREREKMVAISRQTVTAAAPPEPAPVQAPTPPPEKKIDAREVLADVLDAADAHDAAALAAAVGLVEKHGVAAVRRALAAVAVLRGEP